MTVAPINRRLFVSHGAAEHEGQGAQGESAGLGTRAPVLSLQPLPHSFRLPALGSGKGRQEAESPPPPFKGKWWLLMLTLLSVQATCHEPRAGHSVASPSCKGGWEIQSLTQLFSTWPEFASTPRRHLARSRAIFGHLWVGSGVERPGTLPNVFTSPGQRPTGKNSPA